MAADFQVNNLEVNNWTLEVTSKHCPALTMLNFSVSTMESLKILGTTVSLRLEHQLYPQKKGTAEDVLSVSVEDVWSATEAVDTSSRSTLTAVIESVPCASITVGSRAAINQDRDRLRRTVRTEEKKLLAIPRPCTLSHS